MIVLRSKPSIDFTPNAVARFKIPHTITPYYVCRSIDDTQRGIWVKHARIPSLPEAEGSLDGKPLDIGLASELISCRSPGFGVFETLLCLSLSTKH
jgi:hypothetical protein